MMKKIIALLLVLVMVFALAACGGTETPDDTKKPSGGNSTSGKSGDTQTTGTTAKVEVPIPEGHAKYVNQGAVLFYPTDTYKESFMSGVERIEDGNPWIRISISGENYEEAKALFQSDNGNSSDYSLEEITVGEHKALKCIYSDSAAFFMNVYIDTAFIGDKYWAGAIIKVEVAKSKLENRSYEEASVIFEDEVVWEIINSFYFDRSLKYSY